MSSRYFQSIIVQMKDATDRTIGVVDSEGNVIASSELSIIGTAVGGAAGFGLSSWDGLITDDQRTYKILSGNDDHFDYAVFVDGTDEMAACICRMACIALVEAKLHFEERYDKTALVKNILIDNILPGDLYAHARELHFVTDAPRAVYLVRQVGKTDAAALATVQKMFPDKQKDFVLSMSETDIVIIREMANEGNAKEILQTAKKVESALKSELGIKPVIGIGTPAKHLRDLADRYKEAQVAIDVGKVFESDKTIINYENLGIGRLIYQLPTTLCEMYLSEVFKKNPLDSLDEETLSIITKFFENNLNISETSRKLFVHRNTLVYRLGKIKKTTGLDLREFNQAIVFKVALMVKQYLDSQKM
ncbi:MAG: helix-turn-helix domain-containing protein [Oscillospiraceae bacterium]|nr:helix-turn-helix domain-containing protein [Oscillospiraceae bacterium]